MPKRIDKALIPRPKNAEIGKLLERADEISQDARASRTREEYLKATRTFAKWCGRRKVSAIPADPDVLRAYITELSDVPLALSTIELRVSAISEAHRMKGLVSPRFDPKVRELMKGLRRRLSREPKNAAEPLMTAELVKVVDAIGDGSLKAIRDRAVILLGWASALRRSSLVALNVEDMKESPKGLRLKIKKHKGDQEGRGSIIAVPFAKAEAHCPVLACRAWIEAASLTEGPLLRSLSRWGAIGASLSDKSVADIVQARVAAVGLDPTLFSGHSLRAGFASSAAEAGKPDRAIMRQGLWKSPSMLERYVRGSRAEKENAFEDLL